MVGIFAFWGPDHAMRAVLAGMQLIHEIPIYRLDPVQNRLGIPVQIRVAVSEGPVRFQRDLHMVAAPCINQVVHLEKRATAADELTITEGVFNQAPPEIQHHFVFNQFFENERTYRYAPPSWMGQPNGQEFLSKVELGSR